MRRWTRTVAVLAVAVGLTACSRPDHGPREAVVTQDTASPQGKAAGAPGRQATTPAPRILNPAEELAEFAPDGILRWSAVAEADAYEVWAYRDAELAQLAEFSKSLPSRHYRFSSLVAGSSYYVQLYYRVAGEWRALPTFSLTTTPRVVKARLSNPQDELEASGTRATLRWSVVPGADVYEVWIYRDEGLQAFVEASGPLRVTQYQLRALPSGRSYFVQVYSRVGGVYHVGGPLEISVAAEVGEARIVNPQEELDAFAPGGILRWSPVTNASAYEVWIFRNPNGSEVHENSGQLATRSYAVRTLVPGQDYYAQVYAMVGGTWRAGSPVRVRTATSVSVPRLTNSQEELEAFATSGTLRWSVVPGADAYELWVFSNAGLGSVVESGSSPDFRYTTARLCAGATYYVQVYARLDGTWRSGWATRLDTNPNGGAVDCVPPAPMVSLVSSQSEVAAGDGVTLTWSTRFASSCVASDAWAGDRATGGSQASGPVTSLSRFTLTCTGPGGSSMAQVLVTVADSGMVWDQSRWDQSRWQ